MGHRRLFRRRLRGLALACLLGACGHAAPTAVTSPRCRAAPTRIIENGTPLTCSRGFTGEGLYLLCSNSFETLETIYRGVAEFVDERSVPGRIRALRRTRTGCSLGGGCGTRTTSYEYDAAGRLLRRRRTFSNSLGAAGDIDTAEFTAWDSRGRPTRAILRARDGEREVTIAYDDARGAETWSDGEQLIRDGDANIVHEGTGFLDANGNAVTYDYVIESAETVCAE
jgi:hypothetical protein